jgi:hypothetical protein
MPSLSKHDTVVAEKNGKRIELKIPEQLAPSAKIHEDFVSPRYGVKEKAAVLTINYKLLTTNYKLDHAHPFHFTILSA